MTKFRRQSDAHKGDFGRVLLVGGSRGMAGSIALSGVAALRTGSGLVSVACPDRCLETVASIHPALMTIPLADQPEGRFAPEAVSGLFEIVSPPDAIGIGPGMTTGEGSVELVKHLISDGCTPRVFDADALNIIAKHDLAATTAGDTVWTPHPGELQRLTGVPATDRDAQIGAAAALARRTGAVVVVKGGPTVVVDGNSRHTNDTGNPGMATAGSGDVLTGIIASLLGQGLPPWDAAVVGVRIHGTAGDDAADRLGQPAVTALDIADAIRLPTP